MPVTDAPVVKATTIDTSQEFRTNKTVAATTSAGTCVSVRGICRAAKYAPVTLMSKAETLNMIFNAVGCVFGRHSAWTNVATLAMRTVSVSDRAPIQIRYIMKFSEIELYF